MRYLGNFAFRIIFFQYLLQAKVLGDVQLFTIKCTNLTDTTAIMSRVIMTMDGIAGTTMAMFNTAFHSDIHNISMMMMMKLKFPYLHSREKMEMRRGASTSSGSRLWRGWKDGQSRTSSEYCYHSYKEKLESSSSISYPKMCA